MVVCTPPCICSSAGTGPYGGGLVAKLGPTLVTPWTIAHQAPLGIHGILQTRRLEWVAIAFSRESSPPRNRTQVFSLQANSLLTEL